MPGVRDAFFNEIYRQTQQGEDIVVVTSDLGAPSLDEFRKNYGNRYVSVGIAEQNLLTVASGLAMTGKKVVAYGLNPFPVTRAFDQMRNLMASLKIPITVLGLNAGFCSAESGYTHMPIEDFAMVRTLANVRQINPSDETVSLMAAREVVKNECPTYIRFDKSIRDSIYDESDIDFNVGFATYGKGNDFTIVTQGKFVQECRKLVEQLSSENIEGTLIDCYSMPLDESKLLNELSDKKYIVTVEENVLSGGLGSFILEELADNGLHKNVKRMGMNVKNGYPQKFHSRETLSNEYGLTVDHIYQQIIKNRSNYEEQ